MMGIVYAEPIPLHVSGENLFVWTDEDQDVLEFRFRRRWKPRDEEFADVVAWGLAIDAIDAENVWRRVVSCNSMREFGRMRTDYLIERALAEM
jgi:hypothetical protein